MAAAARFSRRLGAHAASPLAAVLFLASAGASWAVSDADLKVAYLFNFASLVSWPPTAFEGPQSPVIIGVVSNDAMADQLEQRLGSRRAKGRPIEVRRVSATAGAAMRGCHVLYVGETERGRLASILREVQGAPVLTVSDAADFARRGGIIAFEVQDKTVRFTANNRSASNSGISLGSDVLRLAREVVSR